MLKLLKPDQYYRDIFSIDLEELKEQGIKGIICDIDNTIVPWSEKEIIKEVYDWFNQVKALGFKICLISNGMDSRVNYFREVLDIPAIGQAVKPAQRAYIKALQILQLTEQEIAVIGDQIFTDILGGNRQGFETILVDPMDNQEFFTTRLLRKLEKIIFKREGIS